MNTSLLIKLASYLTVFVLGFFLCTKCTQDKGGVHTSGVEIQTKIMHDTTTIYKNREVTKIVYVVKPTLVTVYKDRIIATVQPDSTPTLSVRDYQDTVEVVKGLTINYKAQTTGVLDNITLGFTDKRPEKTFVVTTTIDKIIQSKSSTTGLYLGGFSTANLSSFGPELMLVTPKLSVGAGYNFRSSDVVPLNKVQFHIGYNLFPTH